MTWRVAVRDLRAHVARYVLTFVAVTLGVAFVAGTQTLTDMLRASAAGVYDDAYGAVDAVVVPRPPSLDGPAGPAESFVAGPAGVPEAVVGRAAAVEGVASAAPLVSGWAQLVDRDGSALVAPGPIGPVALGWVDDDGLNPFDIVPGGRPPARADEVVIDKRSADRSGSGVGDRVVVDTWVATHEMTITGLVRIAGADSPGAARLARRPLGRLRGTVGRLAADNAARNPRRSALCASALAVGLAVGLVVVAYVVVLGAAEAAWRGVRLAEAPLSGDGVDLVLSARRSAPPPELAATDALLALAVVVALVGVVNAQVLSTVERTREIGLLRALGASRAQVRSAVRWETLFVGLLGTVLALAVGVPLAVVLVEAQRPALPTVVPVRSLAGVAALTLAATSVASLVPAWWSARHISPRPDEGP